MSPIIVIRRYKPGDERNCIETVRDGIWSPMNSAFCGFIFKEITFQLMILLAAIMFIFFGVPIAVCILVIPIVIVLTYIATYIGFALMAAGIEQEMNNISRMYMSNAFSCFWVAEAFESYADFERNSKDMRYKIMLQKQFEESNINVSGYRRKIVGTVALSKSYSLDKGAWVKRLYVARKYRRKGIASYLLNTAISFAIDQGYSSVSTVASEHNEGGRELCLKKGFELKQMYHKTIMGALVTLLMYEMIYQIKPGDDNYVTTFNRHVQ